MTAFLEEIMVICREVPYSPVKIGLDPEEIWLKLKYVFLDSFIILE